MHTRILLGAGLLGLVGCGVFGSDGSAPTPPAGEAPPVVTQDDGGLPEGAPPPSVGTPASDELTNQFGVFVTTSGSSDGDGTKEHPFATIGAGIERVKDLKLRVYVCAGTYKESLTLVNAVSVIGSLGCDGGVWKTGGAPSFIVAPTSPALRAKDITLSTRFDGFNVLAPIGSATSRSSIALIAENASALTVANTKLAAVKAFEGADGTDGIQLTLGANAKGTDGLAPAGPFNPNPFKIPYQKGQPGGVGSCVGAPGHDGESGFPGGNGETDRCLLSSPGVYSWTLVGSDFRTDGAPHLNSPGTPGLDGASASAVGTFSSDGYAPASGTAGTDGSPGHGGHGSNGGGPPGPGCTGTPEGEYIFGGAGAGGGAGGCPGLAGTPGGGGGASIAALIFASAGLSFTTSELVAGAGGSGGKGVFGSAITEGGAGGVYGFSGGFSTNGGTGGRAGFSGNGAGGPSGALAYTGGDVVIAQDSHLTPGTAGAGVAARTNAATNVTIPASASGPAMPVLQF